MSIWLVYLLHMIVGFDSFEFSRKCGTNLHSTCLEPAGFSRKADAPLYLRQIHHCRGLHEGPLTQHFKTWIALFPACRKSQEMTLRGGGGEAQDFDADLMADDGCDVVGEGEEAEEPAPTCHSTQRGGRVSEDSASQSSSMIGLGGAHAHNATPPTIEDLLRQCDGPASDHTTSSEESSWPSVEVSDCVTPAPPSIFACHHHPPSVLCCI
jgi:hypothetical protein